MAVTLSERDAIAKMMSYIEGERARLWEDYSKLLDRLRQLDEIDRPFMQETRNPFQLGPSGIAHTPVSEDPNIALFNVSQGTQWEPTQWEPSQVDDIGNTGPNNLCTEYFEEEEPEEEITYDAPAPAAANEEHKSIGDFWAENFIPVISAPEEIIPKTEIEALKDKDAKTNPMKTSKYRDVSMVAQYVKAILKESGVPLKTSELIKRLQEANIDMSSPYGLLGQVRKYETRIEKVGHGFYQYKW